MHFLNDKEYEELMKIKEAFKQSDSNELQKKHQDQIDRMVNDHSKEVEEIKKTNDQDTLTLKREHQIAVEDMVRQINDMKKDHDIVIARKDAENDVKISEATKVLTSENSKLTIENGILTKEVDMLRLAFKNLGFDVKDMKGILDQLVKGLVSKNTINVLKS